MVSFFLHACVHTCSPPLTDAYVQGACLCPTSIQALGQMPAQRILRKEASGLLAHSGLWLLAMAEPAWHEGRSEQPLSPCAPGRASPAAGGGERGWPRLGPRAALLAIRTAMPRDVEPGCGGLILQLVSSYLGISYWLLAWVVTKTPWAVFSPGEAPQLPVSMA